MSKSRDDRTAVVTVQVLVETTVGSWGPECTIAQAERQGAESALRLVSELLEHSRVRLVKVAQTEVKLVREGK